jgi:hypothetical protein
MIKSKKIIVARCVARGARNKYTWNLVRKLEGRNHLEDLHGVKF